MIFFVFLLKGAIGKYLNKTYLGLFQKVLNHVYQITSIYLFQEAKEYYRNTLYDVYKNFTMLVCKL